jgi:hypothetical protein
MILDLIVAALGAWFISELTDISPWLAVRLVRWAAGQMYAADPDRAIRRREEWEALIHEEIPTKTSTLFFGLGLGCGGLYCLISRQAPAALAVVLRQLRRLVPSSETVLTYVGAGIGLTIWNLPGLWSLIAFGIVIALIPCLAVLQGVTEAIAAAKRRQPNKVTP